MLTGIWGDWELGGRVTLVTWMGVAGVAGVAGAGMFVKFVWGPGDGDADLGGMGLLVTSGRAGMIGAGIAG